jgi:hypothetical protein
LAGRGKELSYGVSSEPTAATRSSIWKGLNRVDHFVFLEAKRAGRDAAEAIFVVDEQNAAGHAALSGGGE